MRKLKTIDAHTESVRTLGFVNDGALLLTGSSDRSILALDTATGKPLAKLEHAHKSAVNRLKVLDKNLVATGDDDGVVKVWDARQQIACGSFAPFVDFVSDIAHVPGVDDAVAAGANGPSGSLVVTSGDGTIAHLDMANWKELGQSDNQEDELLSCVVMKNGRKAVAGSQTGILNIFNYGQWEDISDRFPGHPSSIDAMIKVDEETLLTGSSDGIVRIIGILPNKMLGLVGEHGEMPVERMALSGDNQFLATANFDRTLYDEACTFQDEIDTYELDKFIKGTSKLFVADRSHVDLTSPVTATDASVEFKFKEDLCFNIPFKPTVFVSGRVVLTRDPSSGLFVKYREYWDQKPNDVLRGARF